MRRIPPPIEAEFGVVLAVSPQHLHWAKGTCASVRHFMGDTPIFLLLDGEGDTASLEWTYGVRVLRRAEVDHPDLVRLSFRSLRTKNATLWLAPFETFMFLDVDTVVWGDMRELADFARFDFVLDAPIENPKVVCSWVLDVEAVSARFQDVDVARHAARYVNTGVFFARRNALDLERYLELLRFARAHPGLFFGSQGAFNFLVFESADAGSVRVDQRELQLTTGNHTYEEIVDRFSFQDGVPRVDGPPVVLHWAGTAKPRVREGARDYFRPMTFFRRQFRAARRGGIRHWSDELALRWEDFSCADFRGSNLRGRVSRWRRRSGYLYRDLKRAARERTPDRVVNALSGRSRDASEETG